MRKINKATMLALTLTAALTTGCGAKKDADKTVDKNVITEIGEQKEEKKPVEEKKEEKKEKKKKDTHKGQARSYLTGEWMDKKVAAKRPFACMIGNTSDAMPQYGIGDADVIYEVPVEGAFTRLMAMFQDYENVETIESIRSCRLYFAYFAKEFDAIYAHWGQAVYATDFLNTLDDLDGEDWELSETFGRDSSRKAPHNGYTTGKGVAAGIEKKGYRVDHEDNYEGHYVFNTDDKKDIELKAGDDASVVWIGYAVNKPWFVYDSEDKQYKRYQFGAEQVDGRDSEQLEVKNIIIQNTPWHNEDDNGYLYFETVSSGTGKYITDGKAIDIKWSKENENSPTRYFDDKDNEITLNQGKTWVCVVQDSKADDVNVYATEDEFNSK